jgi:hypothetical protein
MSSKRTVRYLLWDFGDTLSVWRGSPEWMAAYNSDGWEEIGSFWSIGEIGTNEVMTHLAERLNISGPEVYAYLMRVDLFDFFPFTYEFYISKHLPQSMVTVNPPLFRQMAIALGLDEVSDSIVISGEEGTIDKGVLCEIALQRMGVECTNDQVLLIDNKQSNLDAWSARGGVGYHYTSDTAFQRDVASGINGLIS